MSLDAYVHPANTASRLTETVKTLDDHCPACNLNGVEARYVQIPHSTSLSNTSTYTAGVHRMNAQLTLVLHAVIIA